MNPTIAPADDDPRERRALARFAAVQAVLQARQRGLSLSRALHETAQQPWDGRYFSAETLENWLYRFEHGHFAALHDQPRSDQGQKRALDPAVTEALLTLRRQHPGMTLHALTQELSARVSSSRAPSVTAPFSDVSPKPASTGAVCARVPP